MKNQLTSLLTKLLFCVPLMVTAAHAGPMLVGSSTISSAVTADSGAKVTFSVKVMNTGDESLSGIVMKSRALLVDNEAPENGVSIPVLGPGEQFFTDWTLSLALPESQLYPGIEFPLNIQATGINAAGETVSLELLPEGGAL